jgi:SAM-dependent methyltransferase
MKRIPEPELMDTAAQALAYANADFSAPHNRFVRLFCRAFPGFHARGSVLDLGCGPGDVAIRFARRFPGARVLGVDGSSAMLRCGRRSLAKAPDVAGRVRLRYGLLPGARRGGPFPWIISNSLLHHLHDPMVLWTSIARLAAPRARVFIVDLRRPPDRATARRLTRKYAAGEPEVLRRDFHNSLLAAFTPDEIRAQLHAAGLRQFRVRSVSDRHVAIWGRMPA